MRIINSTKRGSWRSVCKCIPVCFGILTAILNNSAMAQNERVAWGVPSQSVRAGLKISAESHHEFWESGDVIALEVWLENTSSTDVTVMVPDEVIGWETKLLDDQFVLSAVIRRRNANMILKLQPNSPVRIAWPRIPVMLVDGQWKGDEKDYACPVVRSSADRISLSIRDLQMPDVRLASGAIELSLQSPPKRTQAMGEQLRISWGEAKHGLQAGAVLVREWPGAPSLQDHVSLEIYLRNIGEEKTELSYSLPYASWQVFDERLETSDKQVSEQLFNRHRPNLTGPVVLPSGATIKFRGMLVNTGLYPIPKKGFAAGIVHVPLLNSESEMILSTGSILFENFNELVSR